MTIPKIFRLPGALAQVVFSSTTMNSRYRHVVRQLKRQPDGERLRFIIRYWYVENAWLLTSTQGMAVPADSGALFRRMKGGETSLPEMALELRSLDAPSFEEVHEKIKQSAIAEARRWPVTREDMAMQWPELR